MYSFIIPSLLLIYTFIFFYAVTKCTFAYKIPLSISTFEFGTEISTYKAFSAPTSILTGYGSK